MDSERLTKLYGERFDSQEVTKKNKLWRILCVDFFQKFIPEDSIVLDIGAGYCEFINNIKARKKYALDLNPDTNNYANSNVEVHISPANDLKFLQDKSVDIIFISNFLEHLKTKEEVLQILLEVRRVCKSEGSALILQPNIRYAYKQYWDFFDHHIPISDKSLVEALQMTGFKIDKIYPQFLPYTTKSRLPQSDFFVKLYLKIPVLWQILGKQAFVVAKNVE